MESRCRLCAETSTELVHILDDMHYLDLPARIMDLFNVKITIEDDLPTAVCFFCCDMVEKICSYSERVQKAQDVLIQFLNSTITVNIDFGSDTKEMMACMVEEQHQQEEELQQQQQQVSLPSQTVELEQELSVKEEIPIQKVVVTSEGIEDTSENKILHKTKNRKIVKKKGLQTATECLPELADAEVNEDGSINPKTELLGWEEYPWYCPDCRETMSTAGDLRAHYSTIHSEPPKYGCADCNKVYAKYSVFIAHVRIHRTKLRFSCDICFKWFINIETLFNHRGSHTHVVVHVCATCGKHFRTQSALLVHNRSHLPAELKNRHQCDQCPKRFGTKPNLMAHKRIHAGVKDYTCDQCGKSFVQKGNLDNHLLTHTAVRPFNCNICGKSFKTHIHLRKHGSVHSGLKPHQCDVCGRQFRERGTLKEHHRIHTGAMPFTCEFCGRSFRFKGVLTTHRRQHTGERPYSCFECQHHFTNWPNYNKHMKRRHGINTSVTVRKPQTIPPTGMPHRNPPGTVLAPPQPIAVPDTFVEQTSTFYPVLNLYNLPEELLQQRV